MNKRRLLKLADFLETVPPAKFNLESWVQSIPTNPEAKRGGSCGFAGCAMGWAIHAKLFRGLTFEPEEDADGFNRGPQYKNLTDFDAVAALFDISIRDSFKLFVSTKYHTGGDTTPKQVAKRIRHFVGAEP